jgi:predicted Zn-dependent peptidase
VYKKTILGSGVKVITNRMPGMHSVALGIWIKAGGRHENTENKGISHYLEHMLFKGTKKYSLHQIKESIEGVGGSLNAFTGEESTCYLAKLPASKLKAAFDILADMVVDPLLPEDEFIKEKTVILEEIKMYKDLPQSYVHELLDALLWPGQPLGMEVIGTTGSIEKMQRDDLHAYKQKHYTPCNIVVSAAGMLEHEQIAALASKAFSKSKGSQVNIFLPATQAQTTAALKVLAKDTEQSHMALGFHSFRRDHPLRYALSLLHVIVGGNMSSRLFNEIREKRGLAYEIGSQVKRFYDTGAFIVHAGMDNQKVEDALSLILQELYRTRESLVSMDEFSRAKEFFIGQLSLALEDTLEHMLWMGDSLLIMDKVYTVKSIIDNVKKVTRKEIQEVARAIFNPGNLNVAIVGPLQGKEDGLTAILGRV